MPVPRTEILDNFNRANSTTLGSNWTLLKNFAGASNNLGVSSNLAYNSGGLFTYVMMYWNATLFNPSQEAYLTITTKSATLDSDTPGVIIRATNPGASFNGYFLTCDYSNDTMRIQRMDNGSGTTLGAQISQALVSGDKIALNMIGSTLTAYVYHAGSWTLIATRTDSTYSAAGYIGMYIPGNHTDDRVDDFGGGETSLSASASLSPSASISLSPSGSLSPSSSVSTSVSPSLSPSSSFSPSSSVSKSASPSLSPSASRSPSASASPSVSAPIEWNINEITFRIYQRNTG